MFLPTNDQVLHLRCKRGKHIMKDSNALKTIILDNVVKKMFLEELMRPFKCFGSDTERVSEL